MFNVGFLSFPVSLVYCVLEDGGVGGGVMCYFTSYFSLPRRYTYEAKIDDEFLGLEAVDMVR